MENAQSSILNPTDQILYKKCVGKNGYISEGDFLELRGLARQAANPGVKQFFELSGIVMEQKPDAESLKQITDQSAS